MGDVYFYHLTQAQLETTLSTLLGKALQAGWRVAVRGTDAARLRWLDEKLWLGSDESFLPHGLEGGPHDADQPVLLTVGQGANAPDCVMSVDGAPVQADEIDGLSRVCILFDGLDPDAVQHARGQWKSLTDAGVSAQYWSQDSGRWEMKAQSGG